MTRGVGSQHPRWRGGIHIIEGYTYIWMPGYHRATKQYAKRADLVLEKKLGRLLRPDELAHHKDGDHGDDSPDNLELMTIAEHRAFHNRKTAAEVVRWDNAAGVTGVCWDYDRQKFRARIQVDKKRIDLGFFSTLHDYYTALVSSLAIWAGHKLEASFRSIAVQRAYRRDENFCGLRLAVSVSFEVEMIDTIGEGDTNYHGALAVYKRLLEHVRHGRGDLARKIAQDVTFDTREAIIGMSASDFDAGISPQYTRMVMDLVRRIQGDKF